MTASGASGEWLLNSGFPALTETTESVKPSRLRWRPASNEGIYPTESGRSELNEALPVGTTGG